MTRTGRRPTRASVACVRTLAPLILAVLLATGCGDEKSEGNSSADIPLPTDPTPANYEFWRDAWDGERWNVALRDANVTEDALRLSFARSFANAAHAFGGVDAQSEGLIPSLARVPVVFTNHVRRAGCDFRVCPSFSFVTLKHQRVPWNALFGASVLDGLDFGSSKAEGTMRLAWNSFAEMKEVWFAEPDLVAPRHRAFAKGKVFQAAYTAQTPADTGDWLPWQKLINLPQAEDYEKQKKYTPREIVVAVLDTGIDRAHPAIAERMFKLPLAGAAETPSFLTLGGETYYGDISGIDASWEPGLPEATLALSPGSADVGGPGKACPNVESLSGAGCSHGTHVGGLIAAKDTNYGGSRVRGVCRACKLLALRAASTVAGDPPDNGEIRDSSQIRAMQFTLDLQSAPGKLYVNVLNMSIGQYTSSRGMRSVIDGLADAGIVLVAAASNQNTDRPAYPAAYHNVMAVCATSAESGEGGTPTPRRGNYAKAVYSNFGVWVDLCAPGQNIISSIPGNEYRAEDGTSMAAPITSGAAAYLMSLAEAQGVPIAGRAANVIRRLLDRSNWSALYGDKGNSAYQFVLPDKSTGVEYLGRGFLDLQNAFAETTNITRTQPPEAQVTSGCIASTIGVENPHAWFDITSGVPFVPGLFVLALKMRRAWKRGREAFTRSFARSRLQKKEGSRTR